MRIIEFTSIAPAADPAAIHWAILGPFAWITADAAYSPALSTFLTSGVCSSRSTAAETDAAAALAALETDAPAYRMDSYSCAASLVM